MARRPFAQMKTRELLLPSSYLPPPPQQTFYINLVLSITQQNPTIWIQLHAKENPLSRPSLLHWFLHSILLSITTYAFSLFADSVLKVLQFRDSLPINPASSYIEEQLLRPQCLHSPGCIWGKRNNIYNLHQQVTRINSSSSLQEQSWILCCTPKKHNKHTGIIPQTRGWKNCLMFTGKSKPSHKWVGGETWSFV